MLLVGCGLVLALAFVFAFRLLCQFLLVHEYCWQLLQFVGSVSSHQPVHHLYECLFKLWCSLICDVFVQYVSVVAFTSLFFSFSWVEVIGSFFSSVAWGFSLQRAGSKMFAKKKHTAEDLFGKSNLELKQLEREKRLSMSKPVPS